MLVGAMTTGVLEGVLRPCLMTALPRIDGGVCLLVDSGVNPDCKPENLYQFGLLGSMYAKCVLKVDNPKVGLLNLGTEPGKGNLLTTAAYQLMNETSDFNFIGNVEARTLFNSNCDVFVCDGFVGNMMLKLLETFWYTTTKRGHTDEYLARFNYELYGGTPILGVNKPAIVGHGISSALAIQNMILQSRDIVNANLSENLKKMLSK
jgi:glycerol-3-phosphate acyltransferase PlsX